MTYSVYYNYQIRIDLTVKRFDAGTVTSKTYKFLFKSLKEATSPQDYWPILTSVGEITRTADEFLPSSNFSSFTINNAVGSFGANRKFSDILERYSPIEQEVVVYLAALDTDVDSVSSWTQVAKGICSSWSASPSDSEHTLTFNVRPSQIVDKVLTMEVNRTISGMENAPDSSLGRAVPFLVGQATEVIPVRISADGSTAPQYAWGTCLYGHTKNVGSSYDVYIKNYADLWEICENNLTAFLDTSASSSAGTYTLNTYAEQMISVGEGGGNLVTGIELYCQGNGLASSTARLTINLYRHDALTKNVVELVTSGRVELSNYNALNAASTASFPVRVSFDAPVLLSSFGSAPGFARYQYAVGYTVTGYQAGDLSLHYSTVVLEGFRRDTAGASTGFEWLYVDPLNALKLKFLVTTFTLTDHVSAYTPEGLTYSRFDVTQFTPDSGQNLPVFDNFPFLLVGVNGTSTYSGGTILDGTHELIEALSYTWDLATTTWSNPNAWDVITYTTAYDDLYGTGGSPGTRNRLPVATFDSRTTFNEALVEICRGTSSRVGVRADGKLFMYPWGRAQGSVYVIPHSDITPIEWRQDDVASVVNRITVKTGRGYLASGWQDENQLAEGRTGFGYAYVNDFNSGGNYTPVTAMTEKSRAIYGDRPAQAVEYIVYPRSATSTGGYLSSNPTDADGEGSIIAEYYLARFATPPIRATFLLPWFKYRALQMFDVISFCHTDFPAFYGTNPEARDPAFDSSSTAAASLLDGYEWVSAQSYRGLVESVGYVLPLDHAPMVRVTVLLLLNPGYDPT